MQATLVFAMNCDPCREYPSGVKPAGTVIDHPQAFHLVRQGCAEPADEQCAAAAGVGPTKRRELQRHYERASRGVQPIDFEAYESGLMVGYQEDGHWKHGANWTDGCEEEYYAAREPEDDDE
jgi:hypothetical protein